MSRDKILKEIEETLGVVPSFFKMVPESSLSQEWELYKRIELEDGPIPLKYRQLIGLGLSAAIRCRYCTLYHTEMAKLNGATDEEIEAAVHYAKFSVGWSAYANGLQVDFDKFKSEIEEACEHARSATARR